MESRGAGTSVAEQHEAANNDTLCRLANGGSATHQFYTDDEEIDLSAPIIINRIDDIATRGGLQERSLLVPLPTIPEDRRVEEAAFWFGQ